ncbi:MAG: hypothetical protein FJZ86_06625 [Chloroflexi bacterium]|nr:hypothetical protein [Chloroflexota bacterium]
MNTKFHITLDEVLKAIEDYPYLRECFSNHLKWLFENCSNEKKDDHIYFKIAIGRNSLGSLEKVFEEAGRILGLNENGLHKAFDFDSASDCNDIFKLGDYLAELRIAVELGRLGFNEIKKIDNQEGCTDFLAQYQGKKFAIEVKNIREKELLEELNDGSYKEEIQFLGELRGAYFGTLPEAEGKSLLVGLERRFHSPKDQKRIKKQLKNTVEKYNCQSTMLIISIETITGIGFSTYFMEQCLNQVKTKYPFSDYLACFLSGNDLYTYPKLFMEN